MNELIEENKKLRKEIKHLKTEKMQTYSAVQQPQLKSDETAIEEAVERIRRSNNVIIRGVEEHKGDLKQQKESDDATVNKLIMAEVPEVQLNSVVSVTRLGKYNPSSKYPRLLKVVFNNPTIVQCVLRHRTEKAIFINQDLTPMQQNKAYTIRKEFRNRVDNG